MWSTDCNPLIMHMVDTRAMEHHPLLCPSKQGFLQPSFIWVIPYRIYWQGIDLDDSLKGCQLYCHRHFTDWRAEQVEIIRVSARACILRTYRIESNATQLEGNTT